MHAGGSGSSCRLILIWTQTNFATNALRDPRLIPAYVDRLPFLLKKSTNLFVSFSNKYMVHLWASYWYLRGTRTHVGWNLISKCIWSFNRGGLLLQSCLCDLVTVHQSNIHPQHFLELADYMFYVFFGSHQRVPETNWRFFGKLIGLVFTQFGGI